MWIFYGGARNAHIPVGYISDICCDVGGVYLWAVSPQAC
jgi:hypothetical protein